ncbi:hypothetical protein LX81_03527 [Palleronia aestuarii]|uniref:Regulatory protein SoxS n=1 Tax=Palleronia aestuarii TaxID=568105 RepID=A0A2W7MYB1_9RHOB|nr:hypothetical protein [Palleronia aestuarii]PZX12820.1 hypothetical protein LX81_03527 [Palleronia aestuarii]
MYFVKFFGGGMALRPFILVLATVLLAGPLNAQTALVMVEQDGCAWCAKWNAEVAPGYAESVEGKVAPLRRIDLHQPVPAELMLDSPPRVTPTFILVENGNEVGRIEGYPGENFFWPMLDALMDRRENR